MISLEPSTLFLLLLAAALAGAMVAVLPAWRRLAGSPRLPVRAFLERRDASVEGRAALQAEIRCALCETQAQCVRLAAAGAEAPPAGCPNAALFAEKGVRTLFAAGSEKGS